MSDLEFDGGLTLSLPVSDLAASIEWYRDVLGMELLYQMDDLGWCELKSPVQRVNVGLSQVEKVTVGETTPTWGVREIEASHRALKAKNVRVDDEIQVIDGMVKLVTFYDPDGNPLMLYQDVSENA
ncbi:MAG: VOC family protein [Pseudomonadota bacterium]